MAFGMVLFTNCVATGAQTVPVFRSRECWWFDCDADVKSPFLKSIIQNKSSPIAHLVPQMSNCGAFGGSFTYLFTVCRVTQLCFATDADELDEVSVFWLRVELLLVRTEFPFTCRAATIFVECFVWCDADMLAPWTRVVFALQMSQFFANESWCCGLNTNDEFIQTKKKTNSNKKRYTDTCKFWIYICTNKRSN